MSQPLRSAIQASAETSASNRTYVKKGIVSGTDPTTHSCKVLLQPSGDETGFIPVKAMWAGNGWGMFCIPKVGTQVEVTFEGGRAECGSVTGQIYDDNHTPPAGALEGEFWLNHESGSFFKLPNSGGVTMGDGQGALITIADGLITSSGNWTHTGTLTASEDVVGGSISLENHVHPDVQSGSSNTGAPTG